MNSIADSNAFRESERMLPQHQAFLTLLQARLSNPAGSKCCWLDLACGRGQIIGTLDRNLSPQARSRLEYWGFDINQQFARETRRIAENLGLATVDIKVGDLTHFNKLYEPANRFDFITLTNTVHEVMPSILAALLVDSVLRLCDTGTLFIYDMERIQPPELGAIPWRKDEVRYMIRNLLDALGTSDYDPEVGLWAHRTCTAWNVQVQWQYLGVARDQASKRRDDAIKQMTNAIIGILKNKLNMCHNSLETLTAYGVETMEEQEDKERLLYEFWAIYRALEGIE